LLSLTLLSAAWSDSARAARIEENMSSFFILVVKMVSDPAKPRKLRVACNLQNRGRTGVTREWQGYTRGFDPRKRRRKEGEELP
jgi:hypothetical protein